MIILPDNRLCVTRSTDIVATGYVKLLPTALRMMDEIQIYAPKGLYIRDSTKCRPVIPDGTYYVSDGVSGYSAINLHDIPKLKEGAILNEATDIVWRCNPHIMLVEQPRPLFIAYRLAYVGLIKYLMETYVVDVVNSDSIRTYTDADIRYVDEICSDISCMAAEVLTDRYDNIVRVNQSCDTAYITILGDWRIAKYEQEQSRHNI